MVDQVQAERSRPRTKPEQQARGRVVHAKDGLHGCQRRRPAGGAVEWSELEPRCVPRKHARELLNSQTVAAPGLRILVSIRFNAWWTNW
jgi:hypothetical protein